jgi:hypothetical protein
MAHVREPLECGVEDLARGAAAGVGDEADATRVALSALDVELLHGTLAGSVLRKKKDPPGGKRPSRRGRKDEAPASA